MSECGRTQSIPAISNPFGSRSLPISMASASALPPPSYALEIRDPYDEKEDFADSKCAFITKAVVLRKQLSPSILHTHRSDLPKWKPAVIGLLCCPRF